VQAIAEPWLDAVRRGPAPFWALETLLREYPLSSAEGTALMRLAEALLRVPDRETAIALTADQLGRATFDPHGHGWAGALSARALALAKAMLPQGDSIGEGPLGKFGSEAVVAMALRAVQLLGRQFVLGESIDAAMSRADASHARHPGARFSYDMLGEGARTDADAQRYLEHYLGAVQALARGCRHCSRAMKMCSAPVCSTSLCHGHGNSVSTLRAPASTLQSTQKRVSGLSFRSMFSRHSRPALLLNIAGGAVLALRSRLTRRVLSTRCLKSSLLQIAASFG
jgi:hypothetical protein